MISKVPNFKWLGIGKIDILTVEKGPVRLDRKGCQSPQQCDAI